MMSHQDHNQEQAFEKKIQETLREVSNETTSAKLDQSILAMAEAQHSQAVKLGFWDRVFRSKQMKYLVSMSAALVMTVGIARFMVHLGKTDQSLAQNPDIRMAQEQPRIVADDYAFELADEESVNSSRYTSAPAKPVEVPELVTNEEMRKILHESERLAKAEKEELLAQASMEKESVENELSENIVVTGSRVKRVDVEASAPVTRPERASTEADANHVAGVMDEAIDMTPKPEVWLAEITQLLEQQQKLQAVEEWTQFKNSYPDFKLSDEIKAKLEKLGLKTSLDG